LRNLKFELVNFEIFFGFIKKYLKFIDKIQILTKEKMKKTRKYSQFHIKIELFFDTTHFSF